MLHDPSLLLTLSYPIPCSLHPQSHPRLTLAPPTLKPAILASLVCTLLNLHRLPHI